MRIITNLKIEYSTNPSLIIFYMETQEYGMTSIDIEPTIVNGKLHIVQSIRYEILVEAFLIMLPRPR